LLCGELNVRVPVVGNGYFIGTPYPSRHLSVPLEELRLGVSGGSRGVHWFMFTLALVWAIYVDARHVYRLEKLYLDNITVYITVSILYSCGDI